MVSFKSLIAFWIIIFFSASCQNTEMAGASGKPATHKDDPEEKLDPIKTEKPDPLTEFGCRVTLAPTGIHPSFQSRSSVAIKAKLETGPGVESATLQGSAVEATGGERDLTIAASAKVTGEVTGEGKTAQCEATLLSEELKAEIVTGSNKITTPATKTLWGTTTFQVQVSNLYEGEKLRDFTFTTLTVDFANLSCTVEQQPTVIDPVKKLYKHVANCSIRNRWVPATTNYKAQKATFKVTLADSSAKEIPYSVTMRINDTSNSGATGTEYSGTAGNPGALPTSGP